MQDRYKDLHKKIKECNAASTVDKLVLRELESLMFASSRNMHTCFLNMLIGIFETFHFNQHFISPELTGYLNEVLKHVQNEMPYISAWAARYSRQSAFPVGKYELILDPPDSTITADMIWEHAIQKILDVSPNQILVYLNMRNQDDDHKTLGMNLRENASIKQYLNLLKELSQRGVKGEQILEHSKTLI